MSKASELKKQVLSRMEERGITANDNYVKNWHDFEIGHRFLFVEEVYRRNGVEENVTVKIYVTEKISEYTEKIMTTVKVPKNASAKVIDRRIDEAYAFLNR